MKTYIYICSKPLQYFNLRNIDSESTGVKKILVVLGSFLESEQFVNRIKKYDTTWNDIVYFESHFQLYSYLFFHPANTWYVEIDASFVFGFFSKLSCFRRMYMFEEGFGSYRRDRFDTSKGIKKWINKCTGVGRHVGFSSYLTGQYLYLPTLFKRQFPDYSKPLMAFAKPFKKRLREELSLFMKLSDGYDDFLSIENKKIGFYLTNHHINPWVMETLTQTKDSFDLLFVKPHPHIRDLRDLSQYDISIIRSNIMIEFLLILLLDNNNELTVFHENSTAVIWFQNEIINRNLGERFEDYDIVASYIKQEML